MELFVLFILLLAAREDIKKRTISNKLILILFLGGMAQNIIFYEPFLWLQTIKSFLLALVLWVPLFYLRVFGGGDVKLLIALSLFFPIGILLKIYFYISLAGGIQALFLIISKKTQKKCPYGVAILMGYGIYWLSR